MPASKTAAQMRAARAKIMRIVIMCCALCFLYLPIVTLIVYSFNESRMVTVWTETSLKWYYALFNNDAIIHAVGISLLVAIMTACTSVVIGTLAAFVLVRVGRFRGESLFVLLMTAPMVLPEVITALALLLIFVTLGSEISLFADRGVFAIWIAHVTFCSAYTTVVIRSRFRELDISIEEAAKDLGAGPIKVFFAIILPALIPSEVAAFLLAFTMSMDDLVITSFIAGPDSTTLPMLIFSSVRRGLSPEINALATIIVFIVSIFTFFAWLSMVKKQKRRKADAAKAASAAASEQKMHYQAPHGDEHTFDGKNLSAEAVAIFKEQVLALKQGKDIADETTAKLHALIASRQAKAAAATAGAGASAASSSTGAAGAAGATASNSIAPEADGNTAVQNNKLKDAPSQAKTDASTASSAATPSPAESLALATGAHASSVSVAASLGASSGEDVGASNIREAVLGDSAKAVTAMQRQASDNLAKAGKAHVFEAETNLSTPLSLEEQEQETNQNAALSQSTANGLGHSASSSIRDIAKGLTKSTATTQSSLAVAKAKRAAVSAANDQALEQAQHEKEILPESAPTASAVGSASLGEHSKALKDTTVSSLEQAKVKAKKQKSASDHSAIAATKLSSEQAKAETNKAKVVDTTTTNNSDNLL